MALGFKVEESMPMADRMVWHPTHDQRLHMA
jgi:hypothetical protein